LYFVGALIAAAAAGLYHPEALVLVAVICVAYVLVPMRSRRELLSMRTWLPLAPYAALGVGFVALHLFLRTDQPQQQYLFGWGGFAYENIARNMAMAGNPLGTNWSLVGSHAGNRDWAADLGNWRTLTPLLGVLLLSFYLLARERRRPAVGVLVLFWFYLSLVPISTSELLGTPARKLYAAGPAFGLAAAIAIVSIWDGLEAWFVTAGRRRGGVFPSVADDPPSRDNARGRRLPTGVPSALMVLVMVVFSVRIAHMTSPDSMGLETHNYGLTSSTEKALIDQIRATYPDLPKGSRLELLGLPPRLITRQGLTPRLRLAVEIYYDDVTVVAAYSEQEFVDNPAPPGTPTYRVNIHCVVKNITLLIYSATC
jgi:hypothetical protein